ncbi:MFS transporter [Pseudomonadota bacterium]
MIRSLSVVSPLLLGVAILLAGQGLQGTLLPVRANLEEFSALAIGLMGGTFYFGFTLGCLRGSRLVRRVGHIRVFAAMTAAASAAPLLHGLWVDIWVWALLRCITGYCFAVLYVVIESWLNELSTNETRGAVFSVYTLITLTMMAGGQQMLLLYDPQQMALFAIASALVSIAAIPVVLSIAPSPAHADAEAKVNLRRLFEISPAGALGCLAAGLANGAFWSLAPVFVADFSPDVSIAAWFMTAAVLGGAAGQWPLGLWSDRIDRRWVMALVTAVGAIIGLLTWWSFRDVSTIQLMALSALWGAVAFPLYAISVAQANDFADAGEYVMISGSLLLMYGIGAIAGPFLAPVAMYFSDGGGLYLFSAIVHLVFLLYILYRMTRRAPAPEDEHLPFADSLASTQTASVIYEDEL